MNWGDRQPHCIRDRVSDSLRHTGPSLEETYDYERPHAEYNSQGSLLLERQAGFEDGWDADREKQDICGNIEDGVHNLVILVGRALNCVMLADDSLQQSESGIHH